MPYLIDGNNLMHALAKAGWLAGRSRLSEMLERLIARGERVCAVFDGPDRSTAASRIAQSSVTVVYAADRSADEIIIERIDADTAPRRLTVVSTDRVIRKAARRRRCKQVTSEEFSLVLIELVEAYGRPKARPTEPPEKRHGLTPEQSEYWRKQFKID